MKTRMLLQVLKVKVVSTHFASPGMWRQLDFYGLKVCILRLKVGSEAIVHYGWVDTIERHLYCPLCSL